MQTKPEQQLMESAKIFQESRLGGFYVVKLIWDEWICQKLFAVGIFLVFYSIYNWIVLIL